jgi:ribosome maturation protein SDO1
MLYDTLLLNLVLMCVSKRPIAVGIIEKAMAEAGFSVRQGKSGKSQVCTLRSGSQRPIATDMIFSGI